ncbi:TetR/AcrR family transcriptional regulator [Peribacillus loiseleuriae]|uniref:TetR/AcrR family transcriptional regulator n=1 Tax=Peribacillus loiseleuriae TaxID=1679170 RepID=UPI0038118B55
MYRLTDQSRGGIGITENEKSIDRREQIIGVAIQLFATNGYHKTKISDIVREAGIAQGTFYWYFKSKESIALEIIQSGQAQILEVVSQGYRISSATVADAVASSEKLFEDLFSFSKDNRYLMELMIKGIDSEESIKHLIFETRIKVEEAFKNNVKRAMDLGILPERDPSIQAALLMSLMEGMLARWLFGPVTYESAVKEQSVNDLAKELVKFEFFGLLG